MVVCSNQNPTIKFFKLASSNLWHQYKKSEFIRQKSQNVYICDLHSGGKFNEKEKVHSSYHKKRKKSYMGILGH